MTPEALTAYLESVDSRKIINTPSKLTGNKIFYIEPDKKLALQYGSQPKKNSKA